MNEVYDPIPTEEADLVLDKLSGLEDRDMAARIAAKVHDTVREAVKDILKHAHHSDFLRTMASGKIAALEAASREVIQKAVEQMTKKLLSRKKGQSSGLRAWQWE